MQRSYSSTIIFLFLLSLSANHLAQAQAIFSHDFENGLNPMKVVDVDNRNPHPDKANFDGEWSVKLTSEGAVGVQSSWYSPAGQSDDWLITPAISITDANTQLRWQARAFNANFREDYEVLLSTTDDATGSFIQPLFDVEGERTTWQNHSVSLADYVGQTVYIAFRCISNDADELQIDNIWVGLPSVDDALLASVDIGCPSPPGPRQAFLMIKNNGSNTITSMEINYSLNGAAPITQSISNISVPPGEGYDYAFPQPIQLMAGANQELQFSVHRVNGNVDNAAEDNLETLEFNVVENVRNLMVTDTKGTDYELFQELKDGKPVILDFFASWCSPCEVSTPALNAFFEKNNEGNKRLQVLGLSIEPSDNDVVVENLDWGATYPKFRYFADNDALFLHYAEDLCLSVDDAIPYFIMLCPNQDDPANSQILQVDEGFELNMFNNVYQEKLDQCLSEIVNVESLESLVEKVQLSPNPTAGNILLEFYTEYNAQYEWRLFDATGQLIRNQPLGTLSGYFSQSIPTAELNNGFYWLSLHSTDGNTELPARVLSRKFVVQR